MLAALSCDRPGEGPTRLLSDWLARHGQPAERATGAAGLVGSAGRCSFAAATVVDGWIDNAAQLALALGLPAANPAQCYEAALARWGDAADGHVIGHYAAVTRLSDGCLRLSRSPIDAPPLFYGRLDTGGWAAASLASGLFAVGHERRLDWDELADLLALDISRPPPGAVFAGICRVPPGTVVTLGPGEEALIDRWYARAPREIARPGSDTEALDEVARLLGEACKATLRHCARPALALSAGLDSPILADELLRHLPEATPLHGITFVPLPGSGETAVPGTFADEWPMVERFAASHPGLVVHRADPAHSGFDHRFRDIAALSGGFNPALVNFGAHHGLWDKARALDCDILLSAGWGNQSFSADGRWSYAEDLRRLRWRRMWRNLSGRTAMGDDRPMWRKIAALALLPNLSQPMRRWLKWLYRPDRADALAWNSVLSDEARAAYRLRAKERRSSPAWEGFAYAASRADAVRRDLADNDHSLAEATLALELLYGLRYRDVTAYRPLVEYCLSLPSEMFVRDGVHRFLARQLARGRLPEDHRLEARTGRHGADWHARMGSRRAEMLARVEAIAGHPRLSRLLDTVKMRRMLEQFPASDSDDEFANLPYRQGWAQGLLAAQFVGLVEQRNDL